VRKVQRAVWATVLSAVSICAVIGSTARIASAQSLTVAAVAQKIASGEWKDAQNDAAFQENCRDQLVAYRPGEMQLGPMVTLRDHSGPTYNDVRILWAQGLHDDIPPHRRVYRTLIALIEGDNVHYKIMTIDCYLPRSLNYTGPTNSNYAPTASDIRDSRFKDEKIGEGSGLWIERDYFIRPLVQVMEQKYLSGLKEW